MFKKPTGKPNFYELEQEILKWWKENDILNKSIQQRPEDNTKTFYDGPITANGAPHAGHALTFSMKDIIPRYWTMKGFRVSRSLGWDCQGLPVEYEVEKNLGFTEKKDIEKYGIAKFNQHCRELVLKHRGKIIELEEMMGRLTNSEEEYATMDKDYIESIWWSLKELFNKGLLYEGFKVVPYSTRAGTTLSNAEVALGGYKKYTDPAITVAFPLKDDPKTILLAWTTTPWTIPSNLGLAVGKDIEYVKVKGNDPENTYIVAKDLVKSVFKDDPYEVVGEISAGELIGKEYIPPFDFFKGRANAHKIYNGFHVTTDSGTGIVHLAPYGVEDNEIFQKVGIQSFDVLNDQGDFNEMVSTYQGKNYRDANPIIIEDLKKNGRLFRHEDYEHDMPMCWRTNTPLIYKPITSWYISMSNLRKELVENNEKINWTPKHIKNGRFGNWLSEIKDWGISRSRYWGTPLPVWKSESGKVLVIGSFEELKKYSGVELTDPHKPYVDDIIFEIDGETYKRIPDVIDVWYDSGSMPFARFHYPFENKEKFDKKFPAQYIAEGVDQTRGWFYSLLAISTALFNKEAYQNVIVNGTILDDHGVKLSKSKKNYVDPVLLIKEFGADTIRLNFFNTSISAGEDTTVSQKTLKSHTQEIVLPLWNVFTYLLTYANIHNWEPREELTYNKRKVEDDTHQWDHIPFDNIEDELQAWLLLRLQKTIKIVTESLDSYDIPKATRSIVSLIDDISKWYIRRSRDKFAEGDQMTLDVLYYVIVELMKLLSPFAPFISEFIYQELVTTKLENLPESVHLTDYPVADSRFMDEYQNIDDEMDVVRQITEMGHTLRTMNQLKVRQPLAKLEVQSANELVPELSDWMKNLIQNELNVKEVVNVMKLSNSSTLIKTENSVLKISIGLETKIPDELMQEGKVREITRQIQSIRKEMKLDPAQKIEIELDLPENIKEIFTANEDTIKEVVKAEKISYTNLEASDNTKEIKLDANTFKIKISTR